MAGEVCSCFTTRPDVRRLFTVRFFFVFFFGRRTYAALHLLLLRLPTGIHKCVGVLSSKSWPAGFANLRCDTAISISVSCFVGRPSCRAVAAYRSKGRLPAVTWMDPATKAVLARSAQPLAGLGGKS